MGRKEREVVSEGKWDDKEMLCRSTNKDPHHYCVVGGQNLSGRQPPRSGRLPCELVSQQLMRNANDGIMVFQ